MASESVKKKQEEEIDLLKLAKVLWKRIWVILICAMILGAAGYYWTYRKMYTSYRSSAMLYVNNNAVSLGSAKLSITSGDIKAVNNLMETYSVILTSRNTLNEIIEETGIPFVATNDVHYIEQKDAEAHDVLLCIQTGAKVDDEDRMRYANDQFYLKSEKEMRNIFAAIPEACDNTMKIAESCNVEFEFGKLHLPKYPVPDGKKAGRCG